MGRLISPQIFFKLWFLFIGIGLFNFTKCTGKEKDWNLNNYRHHQQHRLKTGSSHMFVSLYEHENFKGKVHRQTIFRTCTNIPREYNDWASSIVLHDHCVTLCDQLDCQGACADFYPNQKGMQRLSQFDLNDKISSVKYCYRFR